MGGIDQSVNDIVQGGFTLENAFALLSAIVVVAAAISIYKFVKSVVSFRELLNSDHIAVGAVYKVDGNNGVGYFRIKAMSRKGIISENLRTGDIRREPIAQFLAAPQTFVSTKAPAGNDGEEREEDEAVED